jgi:hypothetical protein
MIKGQIIVTSAILTGEPVPQKYVEAREGWRPGRLHIGLERNNAWKPDL